MGLTRIPEAVRVSVGHSREGAAWLKQLPMLIDAVAAQWSLQLGPPIETGATASWVAPCQTNDGGPAILKIGFPHMEARDEIDGLLAYQNGPAVRIYRADRTQYALLLEACVPGTPLRSVSFDEQHRVLADLLPRLWRPPPAGGPFRSLNEMIAMWTRGALDRRSTWCEPKLVERGLRAFEDLLATTNDPSLLVTDLHAGNVLRAQREPWLAIDPKPFVGDRCYDTTQYLMDALGIVDGTINRSVEDAVDFVVRFSRILGVDEARSRRWMFARVAVEAAATPTALSLARALAEP